MWEVHVARHLSRPGTRIHHWQPLRLSIEQQDELPQNVRVITHWRSVLGRSSFPLVMIKAAAAEGASEILEWPRPWHRPTELRSLNCSLVDPVHLQLNPFDSWSSGILLKWWSSLLPASADGTILNILQWSVETWNVLLGSIPQQRTLRLIGTCHVYGHPPDWLK